ncbi:MAG: DUF72 domain-containing protein [Flavobacterium sp.]
MRENRINIGCSGFYNRLWKGIFYPEGVPGRLWFEYYCEHFSTYEMNGTFYKFPIVKGLQSWHNRAPDDFIFSVKAPRLITHIRRFRDCQREITDFYATCREGLGDKLGHVLFQTPPSFHYSEERLEQAITAMDKSFSNVIEFRHESWWRQDVYNALAANSIAFCSVNYPKLPATIINTNGLVYVRFHGTPKLFYSQYPEAELAFTRYEILQSGCREATVYFNNTASEAGILNALEMKKLSVSE